MGLNLYEIMPALFIRGKFVDSAMESKREMFARGNIGSVFCLIGPGDEDLAGADIDYYHYPISDASKVDGRAVEAVVGVVRQALRERPAVLLHCFAGHNRSGIVAARVVMEELEVSADEAIERVRAARPQALNNPAMVEYLRGLEARRPPSFAELSARATAVDKQAMDRWFAQKRRTKRAPDHRTLLDMVREKEE